MWLICESMAILWPRIQHDSNLFFGSFLVVLLRSCIVFVSVNWHILLERTGGELFTRSAGRSDRRCWISSQWSEGRKSRSSSTRTGEQLGDQKKHGFWGGDLLFTYIIHIYIYIYIWLHMHISKTFKNCLVVWNIDFIFHPLRRCRQFGSFNWDDLEADIFQLAKQTTNRFWGGYLSRISCDTVEGVQVAVDDGLEYALLFWLEYVKYNTLYVYTMEYYDVRWCKIIWHEMYLNLHHNQAPDPSSGRRRGGGGGGGGGGAQVGTPTSWPTGTVSKIALAYHNMGIKHISNCKKTQKNMWRYQTLVGTAQLRCCSCGRGTFCQVRSTVGEALTPSFEEQSQDKVKS